MARYIDAEKLRRDVVESWNNDTHRYIESSRIHRQEHLHLARIIEKQPTADVVEVVRCKDCRHRVLPSKMCMHPKAIGWDAIEPEDDDFCSYGEREEAEI